MMVLPRPPEGVLGILHRMVGQKHEIKRKLKDHDLRIDGFGDIFAVTDEAGSEIEAQPWIIVNPLKKREKLIVK
jgi:hypothetical protein